MLRGAPRDPQYIKEEAPALSNQIGSGDLSYNSLNGSGWHYFAQTDWSGGFQNLQWKDDASFKDGQAIDPVKKYGQITLQNRFTSAATISGSHSYGSHAVHDPYLLIGTIKSGAAKVFSLTSAGTLAPVSAYAGISAVNSMSKFKGDTLIGLTRTSGTLKTLAKYNGSALSGFRSSNPIVRAVKGIGVRAYVSEYIAATSGDQLSYSTDLSTFTSAYFAGKGVKISKIEELNGAPYFFIEQGNTVEMQRWDEFAERSFPIYKWDNLTSWGVSKYLSLIIITGTSNGKKVAFAFNGARLWEIFEDQLLDSSYDFSKPFVFRDELNVKGAKFDGQYWFPGIYDKFATVQYNPFANFANRAYGYAVTGSNIKIGYADSTKFAISGNVIGSEFGAQIGGVDKLLNAVDINCEALATGQTIEAFYSLDGGSSFTSIGTLKYSVDGAIKKKRLNFTSGLTTKLFTPKFVLCGPGTSTPTLKDVAFEYRPIPDLKKRWALSLDAGDNIYLLNKQKEQRDAKAIINELWLEKEAKRTVVYEDIDGFSVKLAANMSSAATSCKVDTNAWMPPKGRIRVLKSGVVEEMTYTSAQGNTIKGISRAQKGTIARAYVTNDVMDNFYTVMVTDIKERLNTTDEEKTESIAQVTLLEV